ncbi:MAG TPA: peptidoglycan-associated lipoprotein Pal [Rickettsiales bacterium]|nr:peptidoglycan-associated lipoprotein Pal [Rickettsiales bacterium]
MFKKLLMLCFVLTLVSACSSKPGMKDGEDYDVIDSEQQANRMNKKTNENIEEVSVPDRVYFAFDKYNISNDSAEVLNLQAEWLKSDSKLKVIIEGHCDERGTREYNLALGERRATAVKNYLVSKGISANRIKTISYGKERPIFVGSGEAVWAKNRVGITVVAE